MLVARINTAELQKGRDMGHVLAGTGVRGEQHCSTSSICKGLTSFVCHSVCGGGPNPDLLLGIAVFAACPLMCVAAGSVLMRRMSRPPLAVDQVL